VPAVAVGSFEDEGVGRRAVGRVRVQRRLTSAHVSAEDDGRRPAIPRGVDLDEGGTKDVARREETKAERPPFGPLLEWDWLEAAKGCPGVALVEERESRVVSGIAAAVGAFGILLLDAGCVDEHDLGEVAGCRGAKDRAPESIADEARDIAAVVNVGVGEEDSINGPGVEGRRRPVTEPELLQALEESAIDQEGCPCQGEEMPGAGDRAGAAMER
jgi:hypothetical protein